MSFKEMSKRRFADLRNTKKHYIQNVTPVIMTMDQTDYMVLNVYYNGLNAARYNTGRDYLTEYMGGYGQYAGIADPFRTRQYWYEMDGQHTNQLLDSFRFLDDHYSGDVGLSLPYSWSNPPEGKQPMTPDERKAWIYWKAKAMGGV